MRVGFISVRKQELAFRMASPFLQVPETENIYTGPLHLWVLYLQIQPTRLKIFGKDVLNR
jgi:hypothetical protein